MRFFVKKMMIFYFIYSYGENTERKILNYDFKYPNYSELNKQGDNITGKY